MMTSHYVSVLLGVALAACAADQTILGSVSLPVETAGPDGATYRLPVDTRLTLASTSIPNYDVSLDGTDSTMTFAAEAGDYQAQLYNADHDFTTTWPLTRTAPDGTVSTVDAQLLTPQPLAATVVANQTTSLVFQFSIATGGTVTFGHGSVTITIGVGQQPATSFSVSAQGSGDVLGAPAFDGPYAAALPAVVPAAGVTGLGIAVSAKLTGAWQEAGGTIDVDGQALSVCAPISLTAATGSGQPGYADLIAEAGHGSAPDFLFGPASMCITDYGTVQEVRIRLAREGVSETPTFTAMFGAQPALFWHVLRGTLPAPIYDSVNGTLDLDALAGTHDYPMRLVTRLGADPSNLWYVESITGQLTFTFDGAQ